MPLILIPLIPVAGLIGYVIGRNYMKGKAAKEVMDKAPQLLLPPLLGSSRSK